MEEEKVRKVKDNTSIVMCHFGCQSFVANAKDNQPICPKCKRIILRKR